MATNDSILRRYGGKVVIVTGGSKGIGRGIVQVFVQHGSSVVFCAEKDDEAKHFEEELNKTGPGKAWFILCDVTKEEHIKNLIDKTVECYGQIDCLINNAGFHPPAKTIDDFTAENFRQLLNMNVVGYFLTAKYALPYLRKTQGNIINNSSLVSQIGQEGASTYVATKGAVSAMTKALAIDEAQYNVRVNSFAVSSVMTPLWMLCVDPKDDMHAVIEQAKDTILLGRFGTLEEIGQACLFLAAEGTFCTGIELNLSGGAELNYGIKNMRKSTIKS